jgi:hypothetical protein
MVFEGAMGEAHQKGWLTSSKILNLESAHLFGTNRQAIGRQ